MLELLEHISEGAYGKVDLVKRISDGRILIRKRPVKGFEKHIIDEGNLLHHLRNFNNSYCYPYVTCLEQIAFDSIDNIPYLLLGLNGLSYDKRKILSLAKLKLEIELGVHVKLRLADCIRLTHQLLESILFIHAAGIAHTDLTDTNIIIQEENTGYNLYVIDLGLACGLNVECYRRSDTREFINDTMGGLPTWEEWRNVPLITAQQSDWFSVGMLLRIIWKNAYYEPLSWFKYQLIHYHLDEKYIASVSHDLNLWLRKNSQRSSLRQLQDRLTI